MLRLITIPISHYCDKARWGLERAGLSYQEEGHLQLFHYAATLRAGGSLTAPVLVCPDGALSESTDILRWIHRRCPEATLYPAALQNEVESLERRFDEELGPSGRLIMYEAMLAAPELAQRYAATNTPRWQQRVLRNTFPIARRLLARRLDVNCESVMEARGTFLRLFDSVQRRLTDGRPFLTGDCFTAADLTFAALSASLTLPPEYGVPLPKTVELPTKYRLQVEACREHPAGAFALRMYRKLRHHCVV